MSAPAASGGHPGSAPAGTVLGDAPESWPVESATEVFRNWLIGVRNDEVRMPDGRMAERSVVTHPGAVSVLALDDAGRALMIRQYRHPVGRLLWELPAGLRDHPGEPLVDAARRELLEETGYRAGTWHTLVDHYSSPGFTTERVRIFLARDLEPASEGSQGPGFVREHEEALIVTAWLALDDAVSAILAGKLHNGHTIAGLLAGHAARSLGFSGLRPADAPELPDLPGLPGSRKSSQGPIVSADSPGEWVLHRDCRPARRVCRLVRGLYRALGPPAEGQAAMKVGVPKEVKNHEYRVAITPAGVHELARSGHEVYVEAGAGTGSSLPDSDFTAAGAQILATADEVWAAGDLILKVKEPVAEEHQRMRKGQVLFTYLHLAASRECTDALLAAQVTSIAYETVQLADRTLPLLAPMSEVAGRMAPQVGAHHLQRDGGGRGVLMGGVSGVYAAKVVVLGAGVSGMNAAAIALGMQAEVLLVDKNVARLRGADAIYQGHLQTVASNAYEIERAVLDADLVIGAVLVPGARAPMLISNELVSRMKPGSVLVDISIDQGGCFEDSRPTTHAEPTYKVHGSVFYCVANMPGAVPHTSTYALTNVTLPYAVELANRGWREAVAADPALAAGLSTHAGALTSEPVAESLGLPFTPIAQALG